MPLNRLGVRLCALVVVAWPAIAAAQASHVSLELGDRGVTLDARDSTLREILDEWERVGGIRILNGDRLDQRRVTLQLTDVPEREAFQILLRDIGGFVLSARALNDTGRSQFASLVVVPANTPLYREPTLAPPTTTTARADQAVARDDQTQGELESQVVGVHARVRMPRVRPGATSLAASSAVVDRAEQESETERSSPEGDSETAATTSPRQRNQVPPTPILGPSNTPDPARPFGRVSGTARPGTVVSTPQGVVYTAPTDPTQGQTQSGTSTPR